MEYINTFITLALFGLTIWCSFIAVGEIRIMQFSKKVRGEVRRADIIEFTILIASILTAGVILFIKPGLIYSAPATVICLELLSIPILFNLSDIQWKNLTRIRQSTQPK